MGWKRARRKGCSWFGSLGRGEGVLKKWMWALRWVSDPWKVMSEWAAGQCQALRGERACEKGSAMLGASWGRRLQG